MEVVFWGVRGSIPTPGKDFSVYGGNTSCVEIKFSDYSLIFDMGSGLKNLGDSLIERKVNNFDILISHFHYDHTCGLPFFKPAFLKESSFSLRGGRKDILEILDSQISSPSFPITIHEFKANIKYENFKVGDNFFLKKNIKISTLALNHPDGAVGYRVEHEGKVVCYITDHEHKENTKNTDLIKFIENSDLLIYDSTYKDDEFSNYVGWGHSTWQEGVRISNYSNVKKYFIFHHNPDNKDEDMKKIEDESKLLGSNIVVAKEGMCVKI
ncbi:MAG: Ribonuclease BN [Alphaproteobacteria bacterium MarineAlpha9_Bin4]|nr:MAG: Ribonuclease BN [Alphaproteobacteria bacterium MarineAlpha9_Bin4]